MINIENTQVITYGSNQKVTVYRDFSDANLWYIVPEPVIPLNDAGLPEFSLVQYNGDKGQVSGTCSFQTELAESPDALEAVKNKLGSGMKIGQFDWQSVKVVFTFATADMANMQLIATPSMYGANRASFIIHLPDQATVNDFINAFGPSGSAAGTFMLEYDVTALTRLPPATVTVNFNSNTAYQYEKQVHVTKNCWGNVTSRSVTVQEHLSQSEAGKITVDPGAKPLDAATHQRLEAWGNATLEADVNQSVDQAMKIIGSNNSDSFSMSSVASFNNVYVEGQVVPWIITPRAPIPAFAAAHWKQVYSTVPNQNLAVAFTVQNLAKNGVESIDLVVTYSTQKTENSYEFTPEKPGTWIFKAPGSVAGGKYDPGYSYQYTVHYKAGGDPYKSPVLVNTDTDVYINANDLNVLQVTFDAANISFAGDTGGIQVTAQNQVDYVLVDFYFVNEADGDLVQDQQAKLDKTTRSHTFLSRTKLPFKNDFQYKLTYVLTNHQQVVIDWQRDNVAAVARRKAVAPVLTLNSPFVSRTVMVCPIDPPWGVAYDMIQLMATYSDEVNNLNEQNVWSVQKGKFPEPWNFLAPANENGQIIGFQGEYIIGGSQHVIQAAKTPMPFINVSTTQETFSVEIDPSQVEWTNGPITQVVVNIYTKTKEKAQTNIGMVPAFTPKNTRSILYDFQFDTGTTPTYYYSAEYWIKDQPKPDRIGETKVEGQGILTLPGKVTTT